MNDSVPFRLLLRALHGKNVQDSLKVLWAVFW